jgi:putative transposase
VMLPERKSNRLARSRYLGRNIYFVTVCCDGRRRVFCDSLTASSIVRNLKTVSESNSFLVHGYCVMPDHVHAVVEGARDESDLNEFVRVFKQVTAFHYKKEHGEQLWQKGYYDHVLRASDSLDAVLWYVWLNPVRAGLCMDARSYPEPQTWTLLFSDLSKMGISSLPDLSRDLSVPNASRG